MYQLPDNREIPLERVDECINQIRRELRRFAATPPPRPPRLPPLGVASIAA